MAKNQKKPQVTEETEAFLRSIREQLSPSNHTSDAVTEETPHEDLEQKKQEDKKKSARHIQALEAEIKDIGEQNQKKYEDWKKLQEEKFGGSGEESREEPPPLDTGSKPKRGLFRGPQARVEKAKRATEIVKTPIG